MRPARLVLFALLAAILPSCAMQLLEDIGESPVPRYCGEPARLFTNFMMKAKKISWHAHFLTIDLVFENTARWPLALSNSGTGIVYSVEYALLDENGAAYAPKETRGVTNNTDEEKKTGAKEKSGLSIHVPIKLGEAVEGKLVFDVPRGNYALAIERKFGGQPVAGNRDDHVTVCKISPSDFSAPKTAIPRGVSGVY